MRSWGMFLGGVALGMAVLLGFQGREPDRAPQEVDPWYATPLGRLFVDPVSREDPLLYPAVTTFEELEMQVQAMALPTEGLAEAYGRIELRGDERERDGRIQRVDFDYLGTRSSAYAYVRERYRSDEEGPGAAGAGILVIPGSGLNQSSAILYDRENNYQSEIDEVAAAHGDVYLLAKPNEDFLAIHDGRGRKVGTPVFVNYLLNRGYSYSSAYLIQSLALSRWLEKKYDAHYVCGLSQGGLAALINALQSEPKKAVIASGYSIFMGGIYESGHDQLIMPGLVCLTDPATMRAEVLRSSTRYLFTWGALEKGLYGREVTSGATAVYLADCPNVVTLVHSGGHSYPVAAVGAFLGDQATPGEPAAKP